jgi:CTP synthase
VNEWQEIGGKKQQRSKQSDLGGTMRLGAQVCSLEADSLTAKLYGSNQIIERHRHRFEVNSRLVEPFASKGLRIVGRSEDSQLIEMVEIPEHPWFVGCQFHPEFTSNPREGHPLFIGFVRAALEHQQAKHLTSGASTTLVTE